MPYAFLLYLFVLKLILVPRVWIPIHAHFFYIYFGYYIIVKAYIGQIIPE